MLDMANPDNQAPDFAALEQPDMIIEDVRRFARSIKQESD
jgi:hypothetical protein